MGWRMRGRSSTITQPNERLWAEQALDGRRDATGLRRDYTYNADEYRLPIACDGQRCHNHDAFRV